MQKKTEPSHFGNSVKSDGFCLSPDLNSPDSSGAFWLLSIFKKQCACGKDVCVTPAENHLTKRKQLSFEKTASFIFGTDEAAGLKLWSRGSHLRGLARSVGLKNEGETAKGKRKGPSRLLIEQRPARLDAIGSAIGC